MTYKIVRFYNPDLRKRDRVIMKGVPLWLAQFHCTDPRTRKEDIYFDGYVAERTKGGDNR